MNLRKQSETAKTITLAWDPVPGADGYLFFADGRQVSRTFDTSRTTARFGKGPASFAVQAVRFATVDSGSYPQATPPPPPPPPAKRLAPQTYNKGGAGQDARYCVQSPGVVKAGPNDWVDEGGFRYDDNGLCKGGRSGNPVAGLKPADQMDGRGSCDPYNGMPPWPAGSYET